MSSQHSSSTNPLQQYVTRSLALNDLVSRTKDLCLDIVNDFRQDKDLNRTYQAADSFAEIATQQPIDSDTIHDSVSSSGIPVINVDPSIVFGVQFLRVRAPNSIRERFNTIFMGTLNLELATTILAYYSTDVWNCLASSDKYVFVNDVTTDDFFDHCTMLTKTKLDSTTGEPKINFIDIKQATVERYFNVIFPSTLKEIETLSQQLVDGNMKLTLRFIDIRSAYVLAMRNRIQIDGFETVSNFHQLLFDAFKKNFRVMAYIGSDGKFVVKQRKLYFGRFNLSNSVQNK